MTTLSKEDVVRMAVTVFNKTWVRWNAQCLIDFATLARADLVAENERLKAENVMREDGLKSAIRLRMELENTRAALAAAEADNERLSKALCRVARWHGEFPDTGRYLDEPKNAEPMSYSACFGSNGERDYMRQVASEALAQPRDDSALREMIAGVYEECEQACNAQVMRFRSVQNGVATYGAMECEISIRALTEKAKVE